MASSRAEKRKACESKPIDAARCASYDMPLKGDDRRGEAPAKPAIGAGLRGDKGAGRATEK